MKLYDEFQNKVIDGAEDAAKEIGAKISCIAPDDITDAAQQVQMIENFISQDVDILLVDPNIADSVLNVLNDAVAKDIKGGPRRYGFTELRKPGYLCGNGKL